MSPPQVQLYEDFANSRAKRKVEDTICNEEDNMEVDQPEDKASQTHIFQVRTCSRAFCQISFCSGTAVPP